MASSLGFRLRVVYTKESLYTGNKETRRFTTIEAHSQRHLPLSVFGLQADLRVDLQIDVYAYWKSIFCTPSRAFGRIAPLRLLRFIQCCFFSESTIPISGSRCDDPQIPRTLHLRSSNTFSPCFLLFPSEILSVSCFPFSHSPFPHPYAFTFVVEACLSQLSFLVITVSSLKGLSASLLHTSRLSRVWNVSVSIASFISPWLQPANLDCESKFPQRLSCSEQLLPQRDLNSEWYPVHVHSLTPRLASDL